MEPLPPVQRPMGIFNQFFANKTETIILKEKILSLSGDSFDIKFENGQPLFRVEGRVMTISGRKSLYDMGGNHLFDILRDYMHIHQTYAIDDPQGNRIVEIKNAFFKIIGSKATISFQSRNGQQESLAMKGKFLDVSAKIVCNNTGAVVARIDRKFFNGRELLAGQQTYALTVAPGVDMALMVALCIALDEHTTG